MGTYKKFIFGETLQLAIDAIPKEHRLKFESPPKSLMKSVEGNFQKSEKIVI